MSKCGIIWTPSTVFSSSCFISLNAWKWVICWKMVHFKWIVSFLRNISLIIGIEMLLGVNKYHFSSLSNLYTKKQLQNISEMEKKKSSSLRGIQYKTNTNWMLRIWRQWITTITTTVEAWHTGKHVYTICVLYTNALECLRMSTGMLYHTSSQLAQYSQWLLLGTNGI